MRFKADLLWQNRGPHVHLPEISIPDGGGMQYRMRPLRAAIFGSVVVGTALSLTGVGLAGTHGPRGAAARQQALVHILKAQGGRTTATHTPDDGDLADQFAQYGL